MVSYLKCRVLGKAFINVISFRWSIDVSIKLAKSIKINLNNFFEI